MGYWRQHEVFDGTYDIDDLLDCHELILVKSENDKRYRELEQTRN
jgi:hypothetical protein